VGVKLGLVIIGIILVSKPSLVTDNNGHYSAIVIAVWEERGGGARRGRKRKRRRRRKMGVGQGSKVRVNL